MNIIFLGTSIMLLSVYACFDEVIGPLACTGCLCFFASHFHELTALEQDKKGKGVQNLHVMAEADSESNKLTMLYKASSPCYITYTAINYRYRGQLHVMARTRCPINRVCFAQVTRGSCDRSFGIHVARIANFPVSVVAEAESIAASLEKGGQLHAPEGSTGQAGSYKSFSECKRKAEDVDNDDDCAVGTKREKRS